MEQTRENCAPGAEESQESTEFQEFLKLSKNAYTATDEAQQLDALGSIEAAFKRYNDALEIIDKSLELGKKPGMPTKVEELSWKMRNTRKMILERISDLQYGGSTAVVEARDQDLPPAYADINLRENRGDVSTPDEGVGNNVNPLPARAEEIFCISDNVQIYFISPQDFVSAPSYPSFLRLVQMKEEVASTPAFLQVGDWAYPLIPQHSPVFRSTEGIYIFPDLSQNRQGSYVGLLLPETVTPEERQTFEEYLLALVGVESFPPVHEKPKPPPIPPPPVVSPTVEEPSEPEPPSPSPRRLSTKIADGIINGADVVSRGLIAGASKTSSLIEQGTTYLHGRMEPYSTKSVVKPEVKKRMKTAKNVTGKAVQVSGFIVNQVGKATLALGKFVAPHLRSASTKLLERTVATDEADASNKMDQFLEVTTGAVIGFGTVYAGLEHAAITLTHSIANNSVRIVQHRYGEDAGELAHDTAATATNAIIVGLNTKSLAPKAIGKRVAKDAGKALVKHHQEKDNKP